MAGYDEISDHGGVGDFDAAVDGAMDDVVERMTEEEKSKKENELLFWVQGVGSIKQMGGLDVYVKHEHCEESLRELQKYLKFDR